MSKTSQNHQGVIKAECSRAPNQSIDYTRRELIWLKEPHIDFTAEEIDLLSQMMDAVVPLNGG